jgi:hypothetical protein
VTELLQLFALDRTALNLQRDDALKAWLAIAVESMEQNSEITLLELFTTYP